MKTASELYTEHVAKAEDLLKRADEVEAGPRCHLAKTYATMAHAHVALAALYQQQLIHTPPAVAMPSMSTESDTSTLGLIDRLVTLPDVDVPLARRPWPDNVLMGTAATHQIGDISRDRFHPFIVTGETELDYIGNWVEGVGFMGAYFPKDTTRPLTSTERERLVRSRVVIV